MSCDEAIRAFFAYIDQALDGERLEALEAHLGTCLDCCDRLEFSKRLDDFVKAHLDRSTLPEGIEERVRRALGRSA